MWPMLLILLLINTQYDITLTRTNTLSNNRKLNLCFTLTPTASSIFADQLGDITIISYVQITSYEDTTFSATAANGTDITSDITLYDYVEDNSAFGIYKDEIYSFTPMDATYNLCINQIELYDDSLISHWKVIIKNRDTSTNF